MSTPSSYPAPEGSNGPLQKKQKTAASSVASYAALEASQPRHSNTKIASAVAVLKGKKGGPMRPTELSIESGFAELEWDTAAQELLKAHEKIHFDERLKLFSYKADHQISTPAQLLSTIRSASTQTPAQPPNNPGGGVSVKSLKDSWTGAQATLDELVKNGDILPMKVKKDGPYKTVYWNEVGLERGGKAVDQEFKTAWHALRVPADIDRALRESGIKGSTSEPNERNLSNAVGKKKGKKAGPRKVKITNTHMAELGVDLTRDRLGAEAKGGAKKK